MYVCTYVRARTYVCMYACMYVLACTDVNTWLLDEMAIWPMMCFPEMKVSWCAGCDRLRSPQSLLANYKVHETYEQDLRTVALIWSPNGTALIKGRAQKGPLISGMWEKTFLSRTFRALQALSFHLSPNFSFRVTGCLRFPQRVHVGPCRYMLYNCALKRLPYHVGKCRYMVRTWASKGLPYHGSCV